MDLCAHYSMIQDRREQARQDLKGLEETVVSAIPHLSTRGRLKMSVCFTSCSVYFQIKLFSPI